MKYKRVMLALGALLLILSSACQMGTATPTSQPPVTCNQTGCAYPAVCDKNSGQCVINNSSQAPNANVNNPGPAAAAINPNNSSNLPSFGCNQTGCPYPAVCDQKSGQCTIYQPPQAPGTTNKNPGPAAGAIAANNPNSSSIIPPVCSPPEPSISQVTSFCANQAAGIGGTSFTLDTVKNLPPGYGYFTEVSPKSTNCSNTSDLSKFVCSGPKDTKFNLLVCTGCGTYSADAFNDFACAQGYQKVGYGCDLIDPNNKPPLCPIGTHYDNALQNCASDATGKLDSPCPSGYPYFYPFAICFPHAQPAVENCKYFSVYLDACAPLNKAPSGAQRCMTDPLTGRVTCK